MKVGIIGLGLIGGSIATDLRKRGFASKILGHDASKLHAETALKLGLVDSLNTLDELIDESELIVLAIPADATLKLLPKVLDKVSTQMVCDVASIKSQICERVKYHQNRKQFVATHPMSGTEHSGPWAAKSGLFDGKATIFCDAEDSDEKALQTVHKMYEFLNMRVLYMSGSNHDVHTAYISHISHISSFALALTVLEKEKNEKNIFDLASGGFDSTVRLAKSDAEMWAPIFNHNADNVLTVLNTYIESLNKFKTAIENRDRDDLIGMISKANRIKRALKA